MKYTLTIYQDAHIINRQRNNVFDDIETYLDKFCTKIYEETNLQLQQIDYKKTLRIDRPEFFGQLNDFAFNYVRLEAFTEEYSLGLYYYFIDDVKRKGSQTLELSLTLDTVQTFYEDIFKSMSPRTRVLREHTNRFLDKEYRNDTTLLPWATIDRNSEGLNPPLYRVSRGSEVEPSDKLKAAGAWYLVYRTAEDIKADTRQPVAAYLMPENPIEVSRKNPLPSGYRLNTFTTTETKSGGDYQYMFIDSHDGNFGAKINLNENYTIGGDYYDSKEKLTGKIRIIQIDTSMHAYVFYFSERAGIVRSEIFSSQAEQLIKVIGGASIRKANKLLTVGEVSRTPYFNDYKIEYLKTIDNYFTLSSFVSLQRTDTKLMKIIKLPYLPLTATYDANGLLLMNEATIEDGKIKINDFEEALFNENIKDSGNYVKARKAFASEIDARNATNLGGRQYLKWNAVEDPKIYSSEFYQEKFQYDNYSYLYKFEDFDITDPLKQLDSNYRASCEISYKQSSIMASRMVFWFDWSGIANNYGKTFQPRTTQDYGEFLFVERSNEMPIYSNAYIDYINNGYNYDRKNLDEQKASRWLNFGTSVFTSAAQTALGLAGGNPFSLTKGIGEATGIFSTVYNNIVAQASAERGLEQKQNDLRRQASSVSACDDMSLFELYGRNLLLSFRYKCSNEVLENVKKLFHYYGYASSRTGVPNIDNRYWFNFIQCTPDFITNDTGGGDKTLFLNFADEIGQRLGEGITIYHVRKDANNKPIVNIEQDKLNIETDYIGVD